MYTNKRIMEIEADDFWYSKVMPKIHRHRICHGRKTSNLGLPIIYKHPSIAQIYVLDMYMYNKRQKNGKKYYHKNSSKEVVLPRMYRYLIDEETYKMFLCTESLGKNYNDVIKKAIKIAPGKKVFDYMDNLDNAPTRKDISKIAQKLMK